MPDFYVDVHRFLLCLALTSMSYGDFSRRMNGVQAAANGFEAIQKEAAGTGQNLNRGLRDPIRSIDATVPVTH